MQIRFLPTTTLVLVGVTLGALIGRRWRGDVADTVLAAIELLTIGLLAVAVAVLLWERLRHAPAVPQPEEGKDRAQPKAAAVAAPKEIALGSHLVLARRADRWTVRLQDFWRIDALELTIALPRGWADRLRMPSARAVEPREWWASLTRAETLPLIMFALSLGVYAITRLVALDRFPIYFFTDEAIHPVLGVELVRDSFRYQGTWLPTYFQNGQYWNLSLSVYLHALTATLFGKSILITRATSAVMSLFGALAIGLSLKLAFKIKWWWLVVLFLTLTPAWFFHSRTAFETVMMVSLYAWFLLCYLLYRYRSPNFLFPALIFGAATLYAYSNGQAVMVASGILLLIFDLPYHLRHWRTGVLGVGLLVLLAMPYLRFRLQNPEAISSQLRILDSYWLQPISLQEKLAHFAATYAYGLSPQYWFIPNNQDLIRHQMKGYGHIALWTLPFFALGVILCLRRFKSAAHRAVLIAALAAPFGSALADIAVTRALLFVVPASMFAALGLDAVIAWFKSPRVQWALALASFVVMSFLSFGMLRDALVNGPTWFDNYGLYGMAWGTKQLFAEAIPAFLQRHPTETVYLTSTWANGTDIFLRFFPVDSRRVQMLNVDYFIANEHAIDPNAVFVMTPDEVDRANVSQKFKPLAVEQTIQYPNGVAGFHFARLAYVDNVDEVFAAEREARRKLVVESVVLGGETVQVSHSLFDIGRVQDLFDGDPFTLARGLEANPLIVEMVFPKPRPIQGVAGSFGKMNFKWTFLLYADQDAAPVEYAAQYADLPGEPRVQMDFDRGPALVSRIRLEILATNLGEPVHVHVRELSLR